VGGGGRREGEEEANISIQTFVKSKYMSNLSKVNTKVNICILRSMELLWVPPLALAMLMLFCVIMKRTGYITALVNLNPCFTKDT